MKQFEEARQERIKKYNLKKQQLEEALQRATASKLELEVTKHYGFCEALQVKVKKSAFVNRFVGRAAAFE